MGLETLNECMERTQMMAEGGYNWDLSDNDRHALKAVLMEVIHLREQLHELREAISPGRIGKPEYHFGVAARLRSKDTIIKAMSVEEAIVAAVQRVEIFISEELECRLASMLPASDTGDQGYIDSAKAALRAANQIKIHLGAQGGST